MANHEGGVHFQTVLLTNQFNYLTVKCIFAVSFVFSKSLKKLRLYIFSCSGIIVMTTLPAYPVSKVGRSSLRVLLILFAVTIVQY